MNTIALNQNSEAPNEVDRGDSEFNVNGHFHGIEANRMQMINNYVEIDFHIRNNQFVIGY